MKKKIFKKLNGNLTSLLFILYALLIVILSNTQVLIDDVVLELCYSGYFSGGSPMSDHLFQHFFLTKTFSFLYTYLQSFNWYFYIHFLFLLLSFFNILNLFKDNKNKYYLLILLVILFYVEYTYFTFTRISFYLSFSGFLYFIKYERLDRYKFIYASLMVILGCIVRPESGFLVLILFVLLFVTDEMFKNKIKDNYFIKQLLLVIVLPLAIMVSHKISNIDNSKRFLVSNLNITESNLYKSSSFKNEIFDVYDFKRLKSFYFDERFTSKEVLKYVKDQDHKVCLRTRVKNSFVGLYSISSNLIYIFIFTILMIQVLILNGCLNKLKLLSIIVILVLLFLGLSVLIDLPLFKDRVFQPLFFSLIIFYYVKGFVFDSKSNKFRRILILIVLLFILFITVKKDGYVKQDKYTKKELNKIYDHIPNGDLIFDPLFFSLREAHFPGDCMVGGTRNYKSHQILPMGWAQRSYSTKVLYSKMRVQKLDDLLIMPNTTILLEPGQLFLWNNYGEKYLNRSLVPYDSVCINSGQSCYYLAKYRPFLIK